MYDILNTIYIGVPALYLLGYILAYVKLRHIIKNNENLQQVLPYEVAIKVIKYVCWLSWIIVYVDIEKVFDKMTFNSTDDGYNHGLSDCCGGSIPVPPPIETLPI